MFLNSAFYEDISDVKILTVEDYGKIARSNVLFSKNLIIYCKTDYTHALFDYLKLCNRKHILITHHSDYSIDKKWFNLKPNCIKKWFAINAQYENENLICIPLGTKTPKNRIYHEQFYDIEWLENNIERLRNKNKINQVYCNWNDTNPFRNNIINVLNENNINYKKSNGLSFIEYCEEMSNYKYVISPPGNGIDCHRTWEALYIGCIPIVIDNYIYKYWSDLSIIKLDNYSYLTNNILEKYINNYSNIEIKPSYWKQIIENEFAKI